MTKVIKFPKLQLELKIGTKLLVVIEKNFSQHAKIDYLDQFGCRREGRIVDTFVLSITDTRDVPGEYDPQKMHKGFKGVLDNGNDVECQWNAYSETSTEPYSIWSGEDRNGNFFLAREITSYQKFSQSMGVPLMTADRSPIKGHPDLEMVFCQEHKLLHYVDCACFDCYLKTIKPQK